MPNFQNVIGSVVTTGPVNGSINNFYDASSNSQNIGAIDWTRLSRETAQLNSRQLPPSARDFAAEMKNACDRKDETKVKTICGKLGSVVLPFAESLGLKLIVSLINACIRR